MEIDFESINKGFSKQASKFDDEDTRNPILQWMRHKVRLHAEKYLKPGSKILELNAGTGLDAVYFAQHGFNVHATDLSEGMVAVVKNKISSLNLQKQMSVQQLSFTDLDKVDNAPFDFIFSNFGGLNCISNLKEVSRNIPKVLKPGGYLTLVMMPPVCPWEMASLFKGNFKQAFRRLRNNGSLAHLEGENFRTWYFSPDEVKESFGKAYKVIALEGLGTFCTPPHKKEFAIRYPAVLNLLIKLDERLCRYPPFNQWADHFIITFQFTGCV